MKTITHDELYTAAALTVDAWDMETLIDYAVNAMFEAAVKEPYAVLNTDLSLYTSGDNLRALADEAEVVEGSIYQVIKE